MNLFVQIPTVINVYGGNVVPQNVHYARSLLDSDKWLVAENEEMESIRHSKVIAHNASSLSDGVIAITAMCIYAFKWTLLSIVERCTAR